MPSEVSVRVQTRLSDLGYHLDTPNGILTDSQSSIASDALFSVSMPFAPVAKDRANAPASGGLEAQWDVVRRYLHDGARYLVTCGDLHIQLIYCGGTKHAEMRPDSEWDAATLELFFPSTAQCLNSYARVQIVVRINGVDTAAWIQRTEGKETFCVYFVGSESHVGTLADVEF